MKSYKSPLVVPRKNLSVDIAPAVQAQQPEVRREVAGARRLDAIVSCLEIPFMHKGLIVACTSIGLLLGWLAITVWPKVYKSEAKLMIKVGRRPGPGRIAIDKSCGNYWCRCHLEWETGPSRPRQFERALRERCGCAGEGGQGTCIRLGS